jgi:integrase
MPKSTNLMRRGAIYYAIVNVPADLLGAMGGKRQIWKSLRTTDYGEAKRRLPPELDQWLSTFDVMRRQRGLTSDDIAGAVWDQYSTGLMSGDQERASRPTPADIDAATDKAIAEAVARGDLGSYGGINAMADVEVLIGAPTWAARRRRARLARLRSDLSSGDTRLIEVDVDAFLARCGFKIEHHGEQYRDLCNKLMRAEIEQLTRHPERDQGDYTGKIADPIVAEPAVRADDNDATVGTIMGLFAKYERENPNSIRLETFTQSRRDVRHFAEFVGPRVRPGNLVKRHVREWKELLAEFPVKGAETKAFAGMSPVEVVAANKALDTPKATLTRQTVRRYMSSLGGFCRWMVKNDYLEANPVADMLPTKTGPTTKRLSFTDDQLTAVFTSPLFRTCLGRGWRDLDQLGNVAVRDHRYWIPLVMLYSGARPGEIAQLFVTDVCEQHGIWTMSIIADEGSGKRTKTKGSQRAVPVHSALIRLGFLDHVKAMTARGERQVFAEIKIPETGQIAAEFSREFNRYLVRIGVKQGGEIVTYSLRHTFIDRARLAGFMDVEIALVAGHDTGESKKTMTSRYGIEQQGTLERRQEIVESMTYATPR